MKDLQEAFKQWVGINERHAVSTKNIFLKDLLDARGVNVPSMWYVYSIKENEHTGVLLITVIMVENIK